jgi:iron-sulfur cluster protein
MSSSLTRTPGVRDAGHERKRAEIGRALADAALRDTLRRAMATLYERRARAFGPEFDFEAQRARARAIKEESLTRSPELLRELEQRVSAAGGRFFFARTGQDARGYIAGVARSAGAHLVVKSKSMTSEEIGLNHALESDGIEVVETDLGERIIQLAGEHPSHLIAPAIHKSIHDVMRIFVEKMGIADPPAEAEGLTRLVRQELRTRFLSADMGITGANFVVAETGTLVLVENEGNIRLSTELPPIHVALVGLEKVIPRFGDLAPLLELLPRSATGQVLSAYVSFISAGGAGSEVLQTRRAGHTREREFHLVVLDNGRRAAAADPELRELLFCIRCGACLNACAPYRSVGGHVYGANPYPGGIGCAWAYVTSGHREAERINGLCTTCSRCTEVCPTKVDIPWLNTVVKERNNRENGTGLRERIFARTDLLGATLSPIAPLANAGLRTRPAAATLAALGIDPERRLPRYERETFTAWYGRRHRKAGGAEPSEARRRKAVLFVDCFMNHNLPGVGRAALEVLETAGAQVAVVHTSCCGRPAMSQGLLEQPRRWAGRNLEALSPMLADGYDVVCIEPSCLSALRDDYRRLLERTPLARDPRLELLQAHSFDFSEYIVMGSRDASLDLRLAPLPELFVVHGHCHQKSLGIGSAPAEALRFIPEAIVHEVEALCCGLVGSFGYKREYSALSQAIGEELFAQIRAHEGTVVASGISCRSQIEQGVGRAVSHPAEVLRRALASAPRQR